MTKDEVAAAVDALSVPDRLSIVRRVLRGLARAESEAFAREVARWTTRVVSEQVLIERRGSDDPAVLYRHTGGST